MLHQVQGKICNVASCMKLQCAAHHVYYTFPINLGFFSFFGIQFFANLYLFLPLTLRLNTWLLLLANSQWNNIFVSWLNDHCLTHFIFYFFFQNFLFFLETILPRFVTSKMKFCSLPVLNLQVKGKGFFFFSFVMSE